MGTKHRNYGKPVADGGTEGGKAALHRFAFIQHEDPAVTYGTGEDGVEAGMGWIRTASGDPDTYTGFFVRNDANDDWNEAPVGTHTHDGDEVLISTNDESGTSYTLVLSDAGQKVKLTNAAAITLTIPLNSSVAFPIGTTILVQQGGAGAVTIDWASGVTVVSEGDKFLTAGEDAVAGLHKDGADSWVLFGNLAVS